MRCVVYTGVKSAVLQITEAGMTCPALLGLGISSPSQDSWCGGGGGSAVISQGLGGNWEMGRIQGRETVANQDLTPGGTGKDGADSECHPLPLAMWQWACL